ncbi:MAG: Crp/Fnr family transcriptional regulator [Rhizobacter sp.]
MIPSHNRMIERLPHRDRRHLLAQCEKVSLERAGSLWEAGSPAPYVHFPIDCNVALLAHLPGHPALEIAMVGHEGLVGAHVVLGAVSAPWQAKVLGAGEAWRIEARAFREEILHSAALDIGMRRYLHVLMTQLSTSASCARFHTIAPRLARWLLMCQDRAPSAQLTATHEWAAAMLGVRRVGVTAAAGSLQRQGLIAYHRGDLTIVDRPGLEAAACSCYAADRKDYDTSFGRPLGGDPVVASVR